MERGRGWQTRAGHAAQAPGRAARLHASHVAGDAICSPQRDAAQRRASHRGLPVSPSRGQQQRAQAVGTVAVLSIGDVRDDGPPGLRVPWPIGAQSAGADRGEQQQWWQQQQQQQQQQEGREKTPKFVRVCLSVHYRVHSRQMLCIGGSQIPFGWSFLSIAKVPMTWTAGDVWRAEVLLPAGQRVEYKYVILEEQDWTKLENEDAEGIVEVTYRSGNEPGEPPDVTVIQKQMAIVAWQPGPNRIVQVPTEEEMGGLQPGTVVERVPARPPARSALEPPPSPDPFEGTSEALIIGEDGEPRLDRRDVWGWTPPPTGRPAAMKGLRFD